MIRLELVTDAPRSRVEYEPWRQAEIAKFRRLADFSHELEVQYVRLAIDLCQGDRTAAATLLGVGRTTLYRILQDPQMTLGEGKSK
jgi:DNA-binding NtrC family response regulator